MALSVVLGTIQAANYDTGGQGGGYGELQIQNSGQDVTVSGT